MEAKWYRVLSIFLGLWLIQLEMDYTLFENLKDPLYPTEADSIGIPEVGQFFLDILLSPFYLSIAFIPTARFLRLQLQEPRWWRYFVLGWLGFSYWVILGCAISSIEQWAKPNHMFIAAFNGGFLVMLLLYLFSDIRRLFRTKYLRKRYGSRESQLAHYV